MENRSHILVVEDDALLCQSIGDVLDIFGYEVSLAADGNEGIQQAHTRQPDLIVTDHLMPNLSGPDMVKLIRQDARFASTPIILMTAFTSGRSTFNQPIFNTEIDEIVCKPFSPDELLSKVELLLSRPKRVPFVKNSSLLLCSASLDDSYMRSLCRAVMSRVSAPVIAFPPLMNAGGHNSNLVEALRASRSLTLLVTELTLDQEYVRYACDYFAGHEKPMTAILYEDCDLPDTFNTCHVFAPDELEAYCDWLRRVHGRDQV